MVSLTVRNRISWPHQEPLPSLAQPLLISPTPQYQLNQGNDKWGLTRCHQSLSPEENEKNPTYVFTNASLCLLPPLLLLTGTQSLWTASHLFTGLQEKWMRAVGRSFQGIPVSPVCVCIYSSRTPRGDGSRASSNWLQTILTTESRTADDGRSETTPRARRDGGTERMCDTGSRWHSPQWDPELLTSLLTTTALKKSIPMATALSKTLWK